MARKSSGAAARVRLTLCGGVLAALALGVAGCSTPETAPPGIPTPSISSSAEWGSYANRDDACFGVANDLLTLALVPNNLALADPGTGVSDIDDTIVAAAAAAPPAVAPDYQQLSALVRSFGQQLSAWSVAAAAAATPGPTTPTPTPTTTPLPGSQAAAAAPSATPSPPPSPSPSPSPSRQSAPERPAFDDAPFTTRLDSIRTWLSTTCA